MNEISGTETFDGRSLISHLEFIGKLTAQFGARRILDFGAGKGKASKGKLSPPDGTIVDSVESLWAVDENRLYDPGYEPYCDLPTTTFDGVMSTDMLEHCPEEDLHWILEEMFSFADALSFCTISSKPAVKRLPKGENAHITVRLPEWWRLRFEEIAKSHSSVRYFAVCYAVGHAPVMLKG